MSRLDLTLSSAAVSRMDDAPLLLHLLIMSGLDSDQAQRLTRSLLATYQSLEHIISLPRDTLLSHPGLGENAAVFLLFLPHLLARYTSSRTRHALRISSASHLESLILPHFQGQRLERVYALCLDRDMEVLTGGLTAQGSSVAVACSLHRVLELALTHQASGVILAHNHPDGALCFSRSDLIATTALSYELSKVGVALLEHYLVANNQFLSLRQLELSGQRPERILSYPGWFDLKGP